VLVLVPRTLAFLQIIAPSASSTIGRRPFSSPSVEVAKSSSSSSRGGGAGFFSRLSSFLVGAGLTALVTEFYIFKEVREGNVELLRRHKEIEVRIAALEKKK
jgi:hypothetical protein